MENTKTTVESLTLAMERMKAIKVIVSDALHELCYIDDAENYAKYNFKRIAASFEAIRALQTEAINLLNSDGIN